MADSLNGTEMELAVSEPAIVGHQLKSVDSETCDPTDRIRKAAGAK